MTVQRMLFAGIDVGSLSTDVVLLDGDRNVAGASIVPTGASIRWTPAAISDGDATPLGTRGAGPRPAPPLPSGQSPVSPA